MASGNVSAADAHLDQDGWEWHYDDASLAILTGVVWVSGSTEINIPTSLDGGTTALTTIAANCFNDTQGHTITKVLSMPSTVASIGINGFYSCTSLTSVVIPSSVTSIGNGTFSSCTSLTSITFYGLVAPTTVGADWILGTDTGIRGHAYAASNFPAPGGVWNGLTMGLGTLASFTMTGYPASCVAGTAWTTTANDVIVTAYDAYSNIKTDYTGQVYFTSTDGAAVLPFTSVSKYTFVGGDNGQHTFLGTGFTLKTTASQTITITNGTISQTSAAITVTPAAIDHYHVASGLSQVAGVGWSGTATAHDAFNNTVSLQQHRHHRQLHRRHHDQHRRCGVLYHQRLRHSRQHLHPVRRRRHLLREGQHDPDHHPDRHLGRREDRQHRQHRDRLSGHRPLSRRLRPLAGSGGRLVRHRHRP
ncbi:MAG: leucine-rich repeat domain-containing protein [Methanomassiliicoccales archaeon]|nr:leucine-rich repeat domain-containing protein [Methanomassiliicoccales archaeon]